MKTIGLIGGMSWESSAVYYRIINRRVQEILGGVHSAQTLMHSVDFGEIVRLQHNGEWSALGTLMVDAVKRLEHGGADFIVLCTNTMHVTADQITLAAKIPFLHIGDAAGAAIQSAGVKRVGLLGTKFTMEHDFLKNRLAEKFSIETLIPAENERETVHSIIYNELVKGIIKDDSRRIYVEIIEKLRNQGAEAIVLGCTEIPLLISAEDTNAILFDTTKIHAEAAVQMSLGDVLGECK